MGALAFAILIGLLVFSAVLAIYFALRNQRRQKHSAAVVHRSFERASDRPAEGSGPVRRTGDMNQRKRGEGRGRFYTFGILIGAVMGTLAVKLWTLQVLASDQYVLAATENMTSSVSLPAIRGRILDRNGNELVGNRPTLVVLGKKSVADNRSVVHRLSLILGVPRSIVRRNLLDDTQGVQADRMVAQDVSMRAVAFIKEHPTLFDDVSVESRTVRSYPYGTLAAQVLGYVGPASEADLASTGEDNPIESGDIVGKDGAEYSFERLLRGIHGTRTFKVDADGNPAEIVGEVGGTSGDDVCLTLDLELQQATDKILADIISSSHLKGFEKANAGALICMDVEDGGVLAMSSFPTYRPSELSGGISTELWEELMDKESGYPLTNRAISGQYPAASTFKAFSGLAGLENGIIAPDTAHTCLGYWTPYGGEEWPQRCWIWPNGHGTLGLEDAIMQSCDVFFYNVGFAFYERWDALPKDEQVDSLQDYLRTWGFGSTTGIDLPGEAGGRVPDGAWKTEAFRDTPEDALWNPGDMTNMCIGQGDILVTPLQLINGYVGIARSELVVPHIFHRIVDRDGETVVSHEMKSHATQPAFSEEHLARIKDGLRRVIMGNGSFNAIPVEVSGKSGTAEVAGKDDFSWFVAYAPSSAPKYCVACVVEQAGDGSSAAILGVLHTLAKLYGADVGVIEVGNDVHER